MEKLIYRQVMPNVPPVTWETFMTDYPQYSIALDGFVSCGPRFQSKAEGGPRANFNHHEEVDRDSTLATCMQSLNAIRTGLLREFSFQGNPRVILPVNDCDEDVCLSTWILENPGRSLSTTNVLLNKLAEVTNKQDMFSGLYPFPKDGPILRKMAWIYNPYRRARLDGTIDRRDADQFDQVITDVHNRIDSYVAGEGLEMNLNMEYKVIGGGPGWSLIEEIGEHARYALLENNINAFISVRRRPDGNNTYSFCRLSKYIDFPIPFILHKRNEEEGLLESENQYGGGTNTGGSPRITGTATEPEEMIKAVNGYLEEWRGKSSTSATAK